MTHAEFALAARKDILRVLHNSLESHIGSNLSAIDIFTVLYNGVLKLDPKNPEWEDRDRFLLSKGHAIASLFICLAKSGYFSEDELEKYCTNGSNYTGEPRRDVVPGVEVSAGSLGHVLNIATGMAYALRRAKSKSRLFVYLGEGECNEGSTWEAVLFAAKHKLSNITVIIDRNGIQSYAAEKDILDMGDLATKFRAFGWRSVDINGHCYQEIEETLSKSCIVDKPESPMAVIAHTVKGKGISFMENVKEWHFISPKKDHFTKGMEELNACVIQ